VWAALAALGPGFFVHGSGAFVTGDREAAKHLALSGGAGLVVFVGAGSAYALSGASRKLSGALLPVVLGGGGVFLLGWLADVYAATTGGRDVGASPWIAPVSATAAYRYVYDPQFAYRNFAFGEVDLWASALRLSPSAWVALDDDNQRTRLDAAYRLTGRTPTGTARDGSYLDVAHALTWHRYPNQRFAVWTLEGRVDGRLDLSRAGRSLRGSFVEGQLGVGLELYDFDVPGANASDDMTGLLLGRFAFGVYFGDDRDRTGEAILYYDHRHDDYAAGLGVQGIGGGFLGHVGARGHYYFDARWGIEVLGEVGSAYLASVGVRYRYRGREGT
jgi:hypothetical protein